MFRKIILILLVLALLVPAVCTWGSIGSAVCVSCLVTMVSALLFRRFLTNRKESDFDME